MNRFLFLFSFFFLWKGISEAEERRFVSAVWEGRDASRLCHLHSKKKTSNMEKRKGRVNPSKRQNTLLVSILLTVCFFFLHQVWDFGGQEVFYPTHTFFLVRQHRILSDNSDIILLFFLRAIGVSIWWFSIWPKWTRRELSTGWDR